MNFGVNAKDTDVAREEFIAVFTADHLWFFDLFLTLKEVGEAEDIKFTDVLIKQNRSVMVGILKNFFSLPFLLKQKYRNKLKLQYETGFTEIEIKDFVEKYYVHKKQTQNVKLPMHLNFSLNIYGLGCFRCSYSHTDDGVVLNIRILDFTIPTLDSLLSDNHPIDKKLKNFYLSLIENKNISLLNTNLQLSKIKQGGLVIHAGPTGSGKSTFIAAELEFFSENISGLIITYEDPIEYRFTGHPKVLQVELDTHLPNTSEEIYKHFLRNSPSIGSLGEIRTREEFLRVIDLASRGHLIFTTMHANNVKEVFSSFAFFEKEIKQLFSTVLLAIISHKLEINQYGKIQPLFEVFLSDIPFIQDPNRSNTKSIFTLFMDSDITKLENLLYVQKGYSYFWSFDQYKMYIRKN